jgi:hypothetical protein
LEEERMSFSLEPADICVVANDSVEVAVTAGFFEEPDVARMEPIEGAGHRDLLPAGRRRQWRRRGKTLHPGGRHDVILESPLAAVRKPRVVCVAFAVHLDESTGVIRGGKRVDVVAGVQ